MYRIQKQWLLLGMIAYAALVAVRLLTTDLSWPIDWATQRPFIRQNLTAYTIDDAFYYLKIAKNVAQGDGATFDGLHLTNGYHPLWLWALVPIFWLTTDVDVALIMAVGYQLLFWSISAGLLFLLVRQFTRAWLAAWAVLLWVLFQFGHWMALSGMEYGMQMMLSLALALMAVRILQAKRPLYRRDYALLGVFSTLLLLARLDNVLLIALLGITLWRHHQRQKLAYRRLLIWVVPIVLVGAAYAWYNLATVGVPTPYSGTIKVQSSLNFLQQDPIYNEAGWVSAKLNYFFWPLLHQRRLWSLPLYLGTVGVTVGALLLSRLNWFAKRFYLLRPFILYSLLHFLTYVLVYHGGASYSAWYFVVPFWLLPLSIAVGIEWLLQTSRWHQWVVLCARGTALIIVLYTAISINTWQAATRTYTEREVLYQGALWAAQNLPKGAVIGAWNAGMVGYFSGHTVINLDGLVNHPRYYQTERHNLCRYWQEKDVTYLVDVFDPAYTIEVIPPYYAAETAVAPCRHRLERIWEGARYPNRVRGIEAYYIDWTE